MTKRGIKIAENHELILELTLTYAQYCSNLITGRGLKQLDKHLNDLTKEMLERNLLTKADVDRINS